MTDWAVYRVFQRRKLKRKGCNNGNDVSNRRKIQRLEETNKPSFIDFAVEYGSDSGPPPPPTSPCCSEGSEIASNKLD